MKSKFRIFGVIIALIAIISLIAACAPGPTPGPSPTPTSPTPPKAPDKIRFGCAISLSGPYSTGAASTQLPPIELWEKEVNEAGGIYLKKYDKKVPIEIIKYDDKSDTGTMVKLVEQLILQDKVDMILPPWGTAMNFAVAPVITKYKYPVVAPTIDSEQLRDIINTVPYFFVILNQPRDKAASMVELAKDVGVKTAAVIYNNDLHGIEMAGKLAPDLGAAGIDIKVFKNYPLDTKDLSPVLKECKAANVDAFFAMSYPDDTFLIIGQSIALDFNPKLFYCGVGTAFPVIRDVIFGKDVIEGICGHGAWNGKVQYPGAKEYFERYVKYFKSDPDFWGGGFARGCLEVVQQAIENVGEIDREKIRDNIATSTFKTVLGPVRFVNNFNVQFPGNIGQWQNGYYEIVAPKDRRTAQPIYPKPAWPKKK